MLLEKISHYALFQGLLFIFSYTLQLTLLSQSRDLSSLRLEETHYQIRVFYESAPNSKE